MKKMEMEPRSHEDKKNNSRSRNDSCLRAFVVQISICVFAFHAHAEPFPKLILLTQSNGFQHDVVKHKDGGPSVVQKTFTELADKSKLFDLEMTEDAAILTPEKLKGTKIVAFYTTGDLPMDL